MILKIDFDARNLVYANLESGRILVKVRYYSQFAEGCHLVTTKGETKEEFNKERPISKKKVFVGGKGGIMVSEG